MVIRKSERILYVGACVFVHQDGKLLLQARKLKPQIPLTGEDILPIAHEFEFELSLI